MHLINCTNKIERVLIINHAFVKTKWQWK